MATKWTTKSLAGVKGILQKIKSNRWIAKSLVTIILSQIGLIIVLLFVVPIEDVSLLEVLNKYLVQGSLLLSVMSLTADLISKYFTDEKSLDENDGEIPLLFEYKQTELILLILILFSSGVLYGVLPEENILYTVIFQLFLYVFSAIMVFRINYLLMNKEETFNKEQDRKGESVRKKSEEVSEIEGVKL